MSIPDRKPEGEGGYYDPYGETGMTLDQKQMVAASKVLKELGSKSNEEIYHEIEEALGQPPTNLGS